ncbi:uncharacterized protein [Procambarus clarkii]|uniref:uncharacterized protein n=1 Tax=Procambarus clarkii TaxID=6728 RepID=UPI003742113E
MPVTDSGLPPGITTPNNSLEISQVWLEVILGEFESRTRPGTCVKVTSFQVNPGTKPGENFSSELVKLEVEAMVTGDNITTPAHYSLVAKFLSGEAFVREKVKYVNGHLREFLIFSQIISELNAFQAKLAGNKYRIDIPAFVYGRSSDDSHVVIMEDLSPLGYETVDKRDGLDLQHALMAVDRLARLHAVSYAYDKTHDFINNFPIPKLTENYPNMMTSLMTIVLENCIKIVENKDNKNLTEKIKASKENLLTLYESQMKNQDVQNIICLCHEDFWTNNMMFKHGDRTADGQRTIEGMMLIDWEAARWHNPVLDLQFMVHSSTTPALRKVHLEELLQQYYSIFTAATNAMGAPIANWNYQHFKKEWRSTYPFGLLSGLFVNSLVLSKATHFRSNPSATTTGVMFTITTMFYRIAVPILMSPALQFIVRASMRMAFGKLYEEVINGNNELLASRICDMLIEANDNGVFDSCSN